MNKISRPQIIAIGTLFILCGIIIFSSQYLFDKKTSLFELINMRLYFNQLDDVPEVVDDPEPEIVEDLGDPEEPEPPEEPVVTESYVAVLEIPKIDLKKGL